MHRDKSMRAPNERIVLVEDFDDLADLTREVLAWEGYEVHLARTGEEALRLTAQVEPSLVLLDIHVPGLRGQPLVDALRALGAEAPHIVVVTGGRERLVDIEQTLQKPFEIDELIDVVRRYSEPRRPAGAVGFTGPGL
ncbi:MAG: response regulator [Myxococcaceae bacterium]|nr:response regulator [Myxococcaceae bacterium]